jgi:hypothetical protein
VCDGLDRTLVKTAVGLYVGSLVVGLLTCFLLVGAIVG